MTEPPKDMLGRSWVHSHEEDTEHEMVFRPADRPLPPARGRVRFEFKPDGRFFEAAPGPADAPEHRAGTWRLEDGRLVLESDEAPEGLRVLEIAHVDSDKLVVKK